MQEPLPDLTPPVPVGVSYTSRPTTITAGQWTGANLDEIKAWVGNDNLDHWVSGTALTLWVEANTSWLPLEVGEWIIKDDLGFYPCKDSVFRAKYRAAPRPPTAPQITRSAESSFQLSRHPYAENSFYLDHFTGALLVSREDLEEAYLQLDDFLYPNHGYAPRIAEAPSAAHILIQNGVELDG